MKGSGLELDPDGRVPHPWGTVVPGDLAGTVVGRARGDEAIVGQVGATDGKVILLVRGSVVNRRIEITRDGSPELWSVQRVIEHLGRVSERRDDANRRLIGQRDV